MEARPTKRWAATAFGTGWLLVFVATLLFQLPFFDLWLSFMDEGHMVQFADLRLRGGEFYRDATFYPLPGAFHFLSQIFEIFGASILVSRWLVVAEFAAFVALLFFLMRKVMPTAWALIGVGGMWIYRIWCFPHWQIYSYSTTSLLVLLACVTALVVYFDRADRRVLLLSGLLFGLGVLCKQDYGAATLVAVVLSLVVYVATQPSESRPTLFSVLAIFLLPAMGVGALTGLYYWRVGVLDDLLRFTVFNHFVGISAYDYSEFPDLLPLFGRDIAVRTKLAFTEFMPGIVLAADWPTVRTHVLFTETALYEFLMKLFFFGPQVFLAVAGWRLWSLRERVYLPQASSKRIAYLVQLVFLMLGITFVLLAWLNRPQDYVHLAVLYWPLVFLANCMAYGLLGGHRKRLVLATTIALVPTLLLVGYSGRLVVNLREMYSVEVPGRRAGVRVTPGDAAVLDSMLEYVRNHTDSNDRLAAFPYFPIVNFLAARQGPHRSAYILWPFPEIPDRDQTIADAMEATGTDLVIYNFTQFFSFDPVWEHAPVLFAYLVENFEIDRIFSHDPWGYRPAALRRRSPEAQRPGRAVMPSEVAGLSLRIDDAGGPSRVVPPEARGAYLRTMLWPFRPVVALRPSAGDRSSVLALPLSVPPEGGRLLSAVAVHPQRWSSLPASWSEFQLSLRTPDGSETLFERRLDPSHRVEDRGWFEIDADLGAWAGQDVTLEFSSHAENSHGEAILFGGWAEPRLVAPDFQAEEPAGPG